MITASAAALGPPAAGRTPVAVGTGLAPAGPVVPAPPAVPVPADACALVSAARVRLACAKTLDPACAADAGWTAEPMANPPRTPASATRTTRLGRDVDQCRTPAAYAGSRADVSGEMQVWLHPTQPVGFRLTPC
jgi:hypothetical protein